MDDYDFDIQNHGAIAILTPCTEYAHDWVDEHLPDDAMRWGGGVVIEPRYLGDIIDGIEADGLSVQ